MFVTDGSARAALAVTRSLGRLGHRVLVGEKAPGALAQASRYCARAVVYPDPVTSPDAFVEFVARTVAAERVDVVLPVADIATMLVTRNRERFGGAAVPFAPAALIDRAADKVDVLETAARLGVPVPRSIVLRHPGAIPESLAYPVVVKPWRSRIPTPDGWMSTSVSYASDRAALERDLAGRGAHEFPVMLQERIDGPGVGVFACYDRGTCVALFSHRRLRERPPWGGVSVLSESAELPPAAAAHATRLLDELGWHGVAMVEFKHDLRDGLPKLMEINGRFWGSLQLAIDAGVNFPALLMQTLESATPTPQPPYRIGVRNRWFWGDVDSLLVTLFGGDAAGRSPASRWRALAAFARLWGRDLHYDNPKRDDVWPWVVETVQWCQQMGRGALGHLLPSRRRVVAAAALGGGAGLTLPVAVSLPVGAVSAAPRSRCAGSIEDLGVGAAEWNTLVGAAETSTIFQTWEWTRSWVETFGDEAEPLFAAAVDRTGQVAGVGAFALQRGRGRERVLRFLGDARADYCDVIAARGHSAAASVVEAVLDRQDWDAIELNNLPSTSQTIAAVTDGAARRKYHVICEERFTCPSLQIAGREGEATAIYNKPSLRRRQNYFERTGTLACRHLTSLADVEPRLDEFFAQHVGRWAGTSSPSLFRDDRNRRFYRRLAEATAAQGWLLFTTVDYNGQAVACHYGFDYQGCVTWYKPTFDVRHAAHSPGLVLVRQLIGYAIEARRRELDFTLGNEPFKARFTNAARTTVRIQVFRDARGLLRERARRGLVKVVRKVAGN